MRGGMLILLVALLCGGGCKRPTASPASVMPTAADASALAQRIASRLIVRSTTTSPVREGLPVVNITRSVSVWPVASDVEKSDSITFPMVMVVKVGTSEQTTAKGMFEGKPIPDQLKFERATIDARIGRGAGGKLVCVKAEKRVDQSDDASAIGRTTDYTGQLQSALDSLPVAK